MQLFRPDRDLTALKRLVAAVLMLALAPPLGIALAALSGSGHRWPDILAQFTAPALVGAVAVVAAAFLFRIQSLIWAGSGVAALLLLAGSAQWAPARGDSAPGAPTLTLYSANLHRDNDDLQAIAASIAQADPDVVVLIEVGPAPAAALDRLLPRHPYRAVRGALGRSGSGVVTVIASRRPLRDLRPVVPGLSIAAAAVETPVGPVTVAGVHLTRPWPYQIQWEQIRQAEGLTGWTRAQPGPVLVAGDFNSVASARIGRSIQAQGRLIPAPGWPGTWPASLPAVAGITIDQVYRSPQLALIGRRLGRETGSDHRPVVTRFAIAIPPAP